MTCMESQSPRDPGRSTWLGCTPTPESRKNPDGLWRKLRSAPPSPNRRWRERSSERRRWRRGWGGRGKTFYLGVFWSERTCKAAWDEERNERRRMLQRALQTPLFQLQEKNVGLRQYFLSSDAFFKTWKARWNVSCIRDIYFTYLRPSGKRPRLGKKRDWTNIDAVRLKTSW